MKNDQRYNDADYAFKYNPENRATAGKKLPKVVFKETKNAITNK
jgi:hypothetical protein